MSGQSHEERSKKKEWFASLKNLEERVNKRSELEKLIVSGIIIGSILYGLYRVTMVVKEYYAPHKIEEKSLQKGEAYVSISSSRNQ